MSRPRKPDHAVRDPRSRSLELKQTKPPKLQPRPKKVTFPPASVHWAELAQDWYTSLAESLQSDYFEPSDVNTARILAQLLTRVLNSSKPSAVMVANLLKAMDSLGGTVAARAAAGISHAPIDEDGEPEGIDMEELAKWLKEGSEE